MSRPHSRRNPYQAWIDTYAVEAFTAGMHKAIALSDQVAATASPHVRDQMLHAFVAGHPNWNGCSADSAYRLERWPG